MASLKDANCPGFTAQPSNPNRCLHCRKGIGRHRAVRSVVPEPTLGIASCPVDSCEQNDELQSSQERGQEESINAAGRSAGTSAVAIPFIWPRHKSRANFETFEVIVSLSEFDWGRLGPNGIVGNWSTSTSHSPRHWPRGAWYVQLSADGPLEVPTPPPQRLGKGSGQDHTSDIYQSPAKLSLATRLPLMEGLAGPRPSGSARPGLGLRSNGGFPTPSQSGPHRMAPRRRFGGPALAEVLEEDDADQGSPPSARAGEPAVSTASAGSKPDSRSSSSRGSGLPDPSSTRASKISGASQAQDHRDAGPVAANHAYEFGPGRRESARHRGGETEKIRTSTIAKPLRARLGPGSAPERGDLFEGDSYAGSDEKRGEAVGAGAGGLESSLWMAPSQPTWRAPRQGQVVAVSKSPVLRFCRAVPLRMPRSLRLLKATSLRISLMFVGGPNGSGRPPVEVGSVLVPPQTVLPSGQSSSGKSRGIRNKAVFLRGNGGFRCVCSCYSRTAGAERRSWLSQRIGGTSLRRSFVVGGAQRSSVLSFREECEESALGVAIPAALCRARADGLRRYRERLLLGLDRILPLLRSDRTALELAGPTQGVRDSGGYYNPLSNGEGVFPYFSSQHGQGSQQDSGEDGSVRTRTRSASRSSPVEAQEGSLYAVPIEERQGPRARTSSVQVDSSREPLARVKAAIERINARQEVIEIGNKSKPRLRRRAGLAADAVSSSSQPARRGPRMISEPGRAASNAAPLGPERTVSASATTPSRGAGVPIPAGAQPPAASRGSERGTPGRFGQQASLNPYPSPLTFRVSGKLAGVGWYLATARNLLCMLKAQAACIAELDGQAAILAHRYRRAWRHYSRHRNRGWGDLGHHAETAAFSFKKGIVRPGRQEPWPIAAAPGGIAAGAADPVVHKGSIAPIQDVLAKGWLKSISNENTREKDSISRGSGDKLRQSVAEQGGYWYKPSALKGSSSLAFLPLNLHLHSMEVQENTVGSFVASTYAKDSHLFVERIAKLKRSSAVQRALYAGSASVDATWGWGVSQFKGMFMHSKKGAKRRRVRRHRLESSASVQSRRLTAGTSSLAWDDATAGLVSPVSLPRPSIAAYDKRNNQYGSMLSRAAARARDGSDDDSSDDSEHAPSIGSSSSAKSGAAPDVSNADPGEKRGASGQGKPSAWAVAGRVARVRAIFERRLQRSDDEPSAQSPRSDQDSGHGLPSGRQSPIENGGAKLDSSGPMLLTDLADVLPDEHGANAAASDEKQSRSRRRARRGSAASVESHGSHVSGMTDASDSSHWSALTFGTSFGGAVASQDQPGDTALQGSWLASGNTRGQYGRAVGSGDSVASFATYSKRLARYQSVAQLAQAEITRVSELLQEHAAGNRREGENGSGINRPRLLSEASRRAAGARSTSLKTVKHADLGFDGLVQASSNLDAVTRAASLAVIALKKMRIDRERISGSPGTWYTVLTMGAPALHAPLAPLESLGSLARLTYFKCFQSTAEGQKASPTYYPHRQRYMSVPGFAEGPYYGMGGLKTGGLEALRLPLITGLGLDDSTSCAAFLEAWSLCCVSPTSVAVYNWRMERSTAEVEALQRRYAWRKWFAQAVAATSRTGSRDALAALPYSSSPKQSHFAKSVRAIGDTDTSDMGMQLEALGMGQILGAQGAGEGVARARLREDQLKKKSDQVAKRSALENLISTLGAVGLGHGVERSSVTHNARPTYDCAVPLSQASMAAASVAIALQRREDRVFAQALSAAVALVCNAVDAAIASQNTSRLAPLAKSGFLLSFESLLSTAGSETSMLRDFKVAVRYLAKVRVRFRYRLGKAQARGAAAIWRVSGVHAPGMTGTSSGGSSSRPSSQDSLAADAPRWYSSTDGISVWGKGTAAVDAGTYYHAAVTAQQLKHSAPRGKPHTRTGTRSGSGHSSLHDKSLPSAGTGKISGPTTRGNHPDLSGATQARHAHGRQLSLGQQANQGGVPMLRRSRTAIQASAAREVDSWSVSSDEDSSRGLPSRPVRYPPLAPYPPPVATRTAKRRVTAAAIPNLSQQADSAHPISGLDRISSIERIYNGTAAAVSESDSDSEGADMARAMERGDEAAAEANRQFSIAAAQRAYAEQSEGALKKLNQRYARKKAMRIGSRTEAHDEPNWRELDAAEVDSDSYESDANSTSSSDDDSADRGGVPDQLLSTAQSLVESAAHDCAVLGGSSGALAAAEGTAPADDSRRVSVLEGVGSSAAGDLTSKASRDGKEGGKRNETADQTAPAPEDSKSPKASLGSGSYLLPPVPSSLDSLHPSGAARPGGRASVGSSQVRPDDVPRQDSAQSVSSMRFSGDDLRLVAQKCSWAHVWEASGTSDGSEFDADACSSEEIPVYAMEYHRRPPLPHSDPKEVSISLISSRDRSQTTLAVAPDRAGYQDRSGAGREAIAGESAPTQGLSKLPLPKLAQHLRDTVPPQRKQRRSRVQWALRRTAERLMSTQTRVVEGSRLAKSPYSGFRAGVEAEAAQALQRASKLAKKRLLQKWSSSASQSSVVRAILGDGGSTSGDLEGALQLARYGSVRGKTDASAAYAVRRLRGRGRFSVFGAIQGLNAGDLADKLRQKRSGSAGAAIPQSPKLGPAEAAASIGESESKGADSSDLKWRAIWYDVQPVLAVGSPSLPQAVWVDNVVAMRLLVLAASIGGAVGPRLAEAAACLRTTRPGHDELAQSGCLQTDGVSNAHALLSLVARDKRSSGKDTRRGRTLSADGGSNDDGDPDRRASADSIAELDDVASASTASLAIRDALHAALLKYPYRIAAPDLLPAPPAAPSAPAPIPPRGVAVPARIREKRQRFSLRGGGIAPLSAPGSPELQAQPAAIAARGADDPVAVIPPEYLSQVIVHLAAAAAEDQQVLRSVQRVNPSLRALRAEAVAGGHQRGRRAALRALVRLAGVQSADGAGAGGPSSPPKQQNRSGGRAGRVKRARGEQAGDSPQDSPPPAPRPNGTSGPQITPSITMSSGSPSGSRGQDGPRVPASQLAGAPGTEAADLPAFCAAAAQDDTLQAAVLLANEQSLVVDLECKPSVFDQLPAALRDAAVPLVPLLFSQGINEAQTFANLQGSSDLSLQQETNQASLFRLQQFARRWAVELAGAEMRAIDRDLAALGTEVLAEADPGRRRAKRPRVLQLAGDIVRALGGGRVTCCKSGKDRTAMSVTLEIARVLARRHGLPKARVLETAALLREWGVRRDVCRKCIGKPRFAFNRLQQGFLPEEYQPPAGSIAQGALET